MATALLDAPNLATAQAAVDGLVCDMDSGDDAVFVHLHMDGDVCGPKAVGRVAMVLHYCDRRLSGDAVRVAVAEPEACRYTIVVHSYAVCRYQVTTG